MKIYRQGAVAPDSYALEVHAGTSGIDMTTVTGVVLKVETPVGNELSWTASISGAVTEHLTATYNFTGTTPFAIPGMYMVHAVLALPSGSMFSDEAEILVKASHEV